MNPSSGTTTARMSNVRKLTMLGLLSAIAFTLMLVGRMPLIPAISFLKYDPKDIVIAFGGFIFGPLSALLMSVIVSLIEMVTVSSTGPIGFIMNVLSTCSFACTAAIIYKKYHSVKGAITGLVSGVLLMSGIMLLWNYLITPLYLNIPREEIVKMLIPAFLPFNLLKGGLNATLTMLLYKPLVRALRRSHVLPEQESPAGQTSSRVNIGVTIISAFLLITCIMIILVLKGII